MKLLFTTLPSNDLGLLTRSLPVADELARRGHTVVYCSPGRAPRLLIAEAGLENVLPQHPLYDLMSETADLRGLGRVLRKARESPGGLLHFLRELLPALPTRLAPTTSQIWDMDHFAALIGMLDEGFVRANCEALARLIADYGPDVVVDFWNPFACIAARVAGKPLVTVIQADMHPESAGFLWWKERPANVPTAVPAINRVLAAYGRPPIQRAAELSLGDLTLVVGTPETDPLPETAEVTYVGALLWEKPGARLPAWIEALDTEQPVIWVYPGNTRYVPIRTPMDSGVVVEACIEALADEGVQVVLSSGHQALPRRFLPLPANFRHTPFVPGLAMARRSDLLIHHGGYGSCQTGLYTGTPALIIPTYSERESNARRVAAVGAGESLPPREDHSGRRKRLPAEEVRAAVRRLLTNPTYKDNARRVSERMSTYGGAAETARLIEGLGKP